MSKTVSIKDLEKALNDYLQDYVEDIEDDVENVTDSITKEATKELQQVSPRGKGSRSNPYYKGWTRQKNRKIRGRYVIAIHNKTNYQLTHLLEFGHATKNGGRTKAIPHIRPTEEKYKKLYEKKLVTVIKRR